MRVECSNKGHQDSGSCIVFAHSSLRILKRDALLRRLSIWIFSRHKKATVSYMIQWLSDGHDSQEIPEENTGINGLDNDGELVSADFRRDASILDISGILNSSY